jgi:hypothetical protein
MARETFSLKFVFLLLLLFVVGSLCSFVFYAPLMRGVPNYYELLNLKPDASMPEIKKAFRVASKQLHPDKVNVEDEESRLEATRKFIEMTEGSPLLPPLVCCGPFALLTSFLHLPSQSNPKAFETLRDSKKRYWYDLSLRSEEFFSFWTSCFKAANGNGTHLPLLCGVWCVVSDGLTVSCLRSATFV